MFSYTMDSPELGALLDVAIKAVLGRGMLTKVQQE